jgi:acyl-[acyl-carrier-protein]-phospholipid O-acyltransferase/long-chain-fatty-acid--[acyl-carrier-protein] ligase
VDPGPFAAKRAIVEARRGLERGDVIGLFAEGSISRTGEILPFQRGLEAITRDLEVPIAPVHLSGLWESVFSYRGGKFFWKRPPHLRQPVTVSFGAPLMRPSSAEDVRLAVQQLGAP